MISFHPVQYRTGQPAALPQREKTIRGNSGNSGNNGDGKRNGNSACSSTGFSNANTLATQT